MAKLYAEPARHGDIIERLEDPRRRAVLADRQEAAEVLKHLAETLIVIASKSMSAANVDEIQSYAGDALQRIAFAPPDGACREADTAKNPDVWVLHISHRYGDSFSTFDSREGAIDSLDNWVAQFWEQDGPECKHGMPEDKEAARKAYFANVAEYETYRIAKTTLNEG
jgi:hypothetical protein